eukprot:TRINITY_DN6512_c0_g1_i2.p1 TRINITY_DN6512_c0_g1~~TRINITY_DN6512_c0_g1_i2.p1  ORF type:complete len:423 (-),score=100.89 TRINITY_DN6512_c0_g1_i2:312-1559(-)
MFSRHVPRVAAIARTRAQQAVRALSTPNVTERVRERLAEMRLRPAEEAAAGGCGTAEAEEEGVSFDALAELEAVRRAARDDPLALANQQRALTDTFGRFHDYLRVSLTERCNLRCEYCMPEEGVPLTPAERVLSVDEMVRVMRVFAECGGTKVRFTGGEPLVHPDVVDIFARANAIPGISTLAVTTNGLLLRRKLRPLHANGLRVINISLDTLDSEKFTNITRRNGFARVLEGIDLAVELGYDPVKVNCVIMRGMNEEEILPFVAMTKDKPVDVRFIEYMPFDGNQWNDHKLVPYQEMLNEIGKEYPLSRLSDAPNDTAKGWQVKGHRGRVSFITSMTENFCSSCNRIRLTADGNLKVCLFGSSEVSLRDAMRAGATDDELKGIMGRAVARKKARHAGMYNIASSKNRPMILIGG